MLQLWIKLGDIPIALGHLNVRRALLTEPRQHRSLLSIRISPPRLDPVRRERSSAVAACADFGPTSPCSSDSGQSTTRPTSLHRWSVRLRSGDLSLLSARGGSFFAQE